ncbi:MAG: circularly permuted type 2 ATP-grasp protein [Verrucomicrobiales bacterium]|nr:circularly permuted type 2 ATP-grasp protein [Verrucomicrobiales bacterium]
MDTALVEPAPASSGGNPAVTYQPFATRRDEAIGDDGLLRPGWSDLFDSIQRHGPDGLTTWQSEIHRLSRERGLAYRPDRIEAGETSGNWSLGPVPWVFAKEDWKAIERGVSQRLRLFDAILGDLYGGQQRLFKEKLIPPQIILSHPGFLRALHDIPPRESCVGLGMAATDLGRDHSGRVFALNDRFDQPFGPGLALENRTIVNTVLPNLFRRNKVRRIGHFFVEWFDHLAECAPKHSSSARVAILDATQEDTDSEISFLANYCGILRVIPSDLTVRNGQVWLKTIGGLEKIDVLWKYTAGRELDPLETSRGFGRGIPGMFEALRRGNVAIASHPGCEVLQSPGLFPYLSKICQFLLGEPLLIPSVATWWCGDAAPRQHVLANLSSMVVKGVGPHGDFTTLYGSRLAEAELAEIRSRIEAQPERFVAQEELALSTVPVSTSSGLVPRGAVLRAFSFRGREGVPNVMPGGLARVTTEDGIVVSTREAGESKDVWVLDENYDAKVRISKQVRRSRLTSPETVTSHAAENLYWVGRNAERIDFISRFMTRILQGRTLGFAHATPDEIEHESILLEALFSLHECTGLLDAGNQADEKLLMVLRESDCPAGIGYHLRNFRRNTNLTREQWSTASILAIESICKGWSDNTENARSVFGYASPLESLQLNLAAFLGMNLDSMTRDHGWIMLDAGRRIERAVNTVKLLSFHVSNASPESIESLLNESILFISDSLGTYQSSYRKEPRTGPMARLLLGESDYPRSLLFLLERLQLVFAKLPEPVGFTHPGELIEPAREHLLSFCERLERDGDDTGAIRTYAEEDLETLGAQLNALSDHLTKSYFSHANRTIL